ncbi:DUF721 domain-containing protein [Pleionea sp. CnH1-48]|uniref:DUF721 domain-containing protein n=1 Tax=Pleionea sp. CnH1-48 TaxID=2954494 RepID=UPI0020971F0A|nr:DciA family protein [Pleionea sp. CnH1-48]MCO7223985.1 DciA family protein [Pleionea sp. CnH1-48]
MTKKRPQTLNTITDNATGSLRYLLDNINRIKQLDKTIKSFLPDNLTEHCHVVNYRDSRLVLGAHAAAWATRLKFETPQLLSQLRQNGFAGLKGIDIIITLNSIPESK